MIKAWRLRLSTGWQRLGGIESLVNTGVGGSVLAGVGRGTEGRERENKLEKGRLTAKGVCSCPSESRSRGTLCGESLRGALLYNLI